MNCEFAHDGMTGNADMDGIVGRDLVRIVAARRTAALVRWTAVKLSYSARIPI